MAQQVEIHNSETFVEPASRRSAPVRTSAPLTPATHYRRQNKWKISKPSSAGNFHTSHCESRYLFSRTARGRLPPQKRPFHAQTPRTSPRTGRPYHPFAIRNPPPPNPAGGCFLSFMPLLVISVQIDAASGIKYDKYKCIGFRARPPGMNVKSVFALWWKVGGRGGLFRIKFRVMFRSPWQITGVSNGLRCAFETMMRSNERVVASQFVLFLIPRKRWLNLVE